jgi:hypothetical protein
MGQSAGVVSVTLNPATIQGGSGGVSTGTVTLDAPAPAGGALVALTSSNVELSATMPTVTVPAGQTTASFALATNAGYRPYSATTFNVTISATQGATTRSAVLTVTAQARPADFDSGSTAGANTQWSGRMCGGIPPIGGYQGVLYTCAPADATGFGRCTFLQECAQGCRRVPPNGSVFNDFCATTGAFPVAISRNYVASGDRVAGTIVSEAPAGGGVDQEVGSHAVRDVNHDSIHFPQISQVFTTGETSVPFEVATSYTTRIQFTEVNGFWFNESIPPFLITNGRAGSRWLALTPPTPAPVVAIPTLGNFRITGLNPITGGQNTFGQIDLSGLSRVGGPTFTVTSSHPAIVPSSSIDAPASQNLFGFQVPLATNAPAADTDVTLTVSDGRYSFSDVLTVRAPGPPPVLAGVAVNPTSVVGGNPATGTVTLSSPQTTSKVVQVSIIEGAPASLPGTAPPCPPSSLCHNVTVPAGATSASFTIGTSPVTFQFNLNIYATLTGSPQRQALLLITPGGSLAAKAMAVNPVSMVGGASATGTVTLTGAAPAGGAVVTLSKAFSGVGTGTVPVTIPASVTVPAGQTTANFNIASSAVIATTVVRVSGTYGGSTVNADLSLFPLLGQIVFEGTVTGGAPANGTVRLNGPAPGGGAVVALSSGNTSLVTVPASVTVPAGQTAAAFTANTQPVSQFTGVTISASHAGTSVNTTLFLAVSTAITSVTLNPGTVTGGNSSTATVRLQSAPTSNAFIVLGSGDPSIATVPNSIVIPGGQTSGTFTVNTAAVLAATTVQISATRDNVTRTGTLTVTPPGGGGGGGGVPGFLSPAAAAADSGGDGNGFQANAVNAFADDGLVATDTDSGTGTSTTCTNTGKDRHRFFNYGIAIPAGSAITGIEVRLHARADSTSGTPRMCVQLSWDGGTTWTAAETTGTLGTTTAPFTLGAATDTWGRTWTAANFADASFRLRVIDIASSTARDFSLDWVGVRVHTGTASSSSATLTVTADGRSGERITSSPAGINVTVGSSGSASFASGTAITLSVTNGRDAIWAGGCSSGGNKTRTCTFTLNADASVSANVQ